MKQWLIDKTFIPKRSFGRKIDESRSKFNGELLQFILFVLCC
jgi:hypothetical protein